MNKCLPYNNLKTYLKKLTQDFLVYFPVKTGKEIFFTSDQSLIDHFHPGLPQTPPKEFFLPPEENLSCDNHVQDLPHKKPIILFGLHPFDIHALTILDKIFLKNNSDFYYKRRRENTFIVGLGDYTFDADFNCDIFLESNGDTFEVILKNNKADFLLNYRGIFSKSIFDKEREIHERDPLFADPKKLAEAVKASRNWPIWDDLAQIDLGCGICSYTCPLCYCFDISEHFCFNNKNKTCRKKTWSSCYKKDFSAVSGHNFRPELKDRIYNWYYHKFVRFYTETGHVGCVDCGRCINYCPAKINFKHVLKSILNDYDKSLSKQKN